MAKKASRMPRKAPSQERAHRTVDALIEATAQVLVKEGWHGTTTNKVATRAGTSIGTLYEYFPSREALVTAVIERFAEDMVTKMLQRMDQAIANPCESSVRFWITAMVDILEHEAVLVRVLATQVPFIWEIPLIQKLQRRLEGIAGARGEEITRLIGKQYSAESVYLMTSIAKSTILQIATDRPPGLDRELLISEFCTLFTNQFLRQASAD